jgi:hypothetical protein
VEKNMTNQIIKSFPSKSSLTFLVRIVKLGDKYGLNNVLVNESKPLVEFYDVRYPHTEFGQFVSRYYAETMLATVGGLNLDTSGCEDWWIDAETMIFVRDFIKHSVSE